MRRLLAIAGIVLLAACSGTPKKSAAPPAATSIPPPPASGATRKVSPYAPAQEDPNTRGDYVRGGLYKPGVSDTTPDYIPDVDAIPEPDIVAEPRSRYGNRSPYSVLGKSYTVRDTSDGYVEQGQASYYGSKFHGRRTSNQEVYDMYAFTAAHKSLPLPSFARVTNLDNGKSVVVRVNDRGPFHAGRIVDLSYAAAVKIGVHPRGVGRVEVRGLSPGENARQTYDTIVARPVTERPVTDPATGLPPGVRIATGKPQPMPPSAIDNLIEALPIGSANAGERTPVAALPAQAAATPSGGAQEWRFDMHQDGKAMTADEFDAWMRARRARVATGVAGKPDPHGSAAPGAPLAAAKSAPESVPVPAPETAIAARVADAAPTPAPSPAAGPRVTLQVAAFGARANADRALAMLQRAGIAGARLLDGTSAGKPIWRLRVGPVDTVGIAELSARVAGLGFGTPQIVRE